MVKYYEPDQITVQTISSIRRVIANHTGISQHLIEASVNIDDGGLILTASGYDKSFLSISCGMETTIAELTELVKTELGIQKLLGTIPTDPKSAHERMSVPTPMNIIRPE